MRSLTLLSALVTTLVVAVPAFAQEEGSEGGETAPKPKPAPKPVAYAAPAAAPAAAVADTKSDHETVTGRLGVGYLGSLQTPLGGGAGKATPLTAHIVGIRYWAQSAIAITGGLGFGSSSSSSSTNGVTTDGPAATTFALKGGVAIALASGKHFTFVLEPQAVFGYASQTITLPTPGAGTIDLTGNRFMIGSTVGGEIQFGFMGIPELSLVGSVGLAFDTQSGKTKVNSAAPSESADSSTGVGTFTLANPWNIFAGNIAAIYYL